MDGDNAWSSADIEFLYGTAGDKPVVGDWTGNDEERIGVFRNGQWWLDIDGDHQWSSQTDRLFVYGIAGDQPLLMPWP
jgi:hypothetical protein